MGYRRPRAQTLRCSPGGLPVRDTRAPRTAIGARHHAARIVRSSHACHAHEGGTLRRDRQIPRRLFLRLHTLDARRARGLHLDPLGARTVGSTTEAAPVVQGNGRWRCSPVGCCKSNDQRRSVYRPERSARSGSSATRTLPEAAFFGRLRPGKVASTSSERARCQGLLATPHNRLQTKLGANR